MRCFFRTSPSRLVLRFAATAILISVSVGLLFRSVSAVSNESGSSSVRLVRRDVNVDPGTYVINRQNGSRTFEYTPSVVHFAMRVLFESYLITSPFIRMQMSLQTQLYGGAKNRPSSASEIPSFIQTYGIDTSELLQPNISAYNTFNEFFYRQLKSGARPIDSSVNTVVSAADCRLSVFNTVDDATRIWIKGRTFSVQTLLQDDNLAKTFNNGSLAIFRLAPQDYHRFHSPVSGNIVNVTNITGTFYTVNPIAICSKLDVLNENRRTVVIINSDLFGQVAFVEIGATLVGSIVNTGAQVGATVAKGDELGYFAYGGSTIVVLFEPGRVQWDSDLQGWSSQALETLVKAGEHIGVAGSGATSAGGSGQTAPAP